jgi:photosystem II stability/assembly factor-like uncharacterized protein
MTKVITSFVFLGAILLPLAVLGQDGWTNQIPASEYPGLQGIFAIDSAHVWAVGMEGTILHTEDGGATWEVVPSGYADNFNNVLFINRDTGFIAGNPAEGDAFMIRTLDGGESWQRLGLPTAVTTTVNDIGYGCSANGDSLILYAAGGLGHIWKSGGAGDSWTLLQGGCRNGNFNACCIVDEQTGWFVGTPDAQYSETIMVTTDGGISFGEQTNPEQRKLNGVSFVDASHGVAAGLSYTLLYTENGGETWETRPNTGYRWQDVHLDGSGRAWAVGDKGTIAYSEDFGYTWNPQESGMSVELWDVSFINDREGWIAAGGIGNPGYVLHTTTGGVGSTGIHPADPLRATSLGQPYPNPVKHTARIGYYIQAPALVTISLYDILGNKLKDLVREFTPPGEHSVDFDADGHAEGLYFYDLKVGSQWIQTNRMVILK